MSDLPAEYLQVVGCHHYWENVLRVIQDAKNRKGCSQFRYSGFALLLPEPDNPADSNAVKVVVEGACVGYIAKEYAPLIKTQLTSQNSTVPCELIWNGQNESAGLASCSLFSF
jgi:hypothetical protein